MTRARWRHLADLTGTALLWSGALCFVFALWLTYGRPFNNFEPATLDKLLHGGASRPYSSRLLVPWVARAAVAPVPVATRHAWADRLTAENPSIAHALRLFGGDRETAAELLAVVLLEGVAFALFLFVLARLFRSLYASSAWVARWAPPIALLILPLFFRQGDHMIYDPPALLFAAWALLAISRANLRALYPLVFLGTLNKETMLVALLVFLLPRFRSTIGERWPVHLAGLAATGALARATAVLASTPWAAPGPHNSIIRNYFFVNALDFARNPLLVDAGRLAAVLFLALLVFGGFRRKPELLRAVAPVALPLAALHLVGSLWGEIRSLYELFPIFFLMGYQTAIEWVGMEVTLHPTGSPPGDPHAAEARPSTPWVALAAAIIGSFLLASAIAIVRYVIFGLPVA